MYMTRNMSHKIMTYRYIKYSDLVVCEPLHTIVTWTYLLSILISFLRTMFDVLYAIFAAFLAKITG